MTAGLATGAGFTTDPDPWLSGISSACPYDCRLAAAGFVLERVGVADEPPADRRWVHGKEPGGLLGRIEPDAQQFGFRHRFSSRSILPKAGGPAMAFREGKKRRCPVGEERQARLTRGRDGGGASPDSYSETRCDHHAGTSSSPEARQRTVPS